MFCDLSIPVGNKALVTKNLNFVCGSCAPLLYERLRSDLEELEREIREYAERLGHKLSHFSPGYYCDKKIATLVAECFRCHETVCYQLVDVLRDYRTPLKIIYKPTGFPMEHKCI